VTTPPGALPVVIAASGTGGHIYPGLALAEALRRQRPDSPIVFAGTPRGLEREIVGRAGYPLELYPMVPFAGANRLRTPVALARSAWRARSIIRRHGAGVVVTMGGYGGIPIVLGARLAGVPSVIHESGAVAGRANKLAARFTEHVAIAFESSARDFPGRSTVNTGMPLSARLARFDRAALRSEARAAFGIAGDTAMLLIVGGSQGAVTLNDAAVALATRWSTAPHCRDDVTIMLKTGSAHAAGVQASIDAAGCGRRIRALPFLDRMDHAYAAADLVVCRAGAGTVAEIAIAGLPAIFVPYPGAVDDHQAANARPLVDAGAAVLVRDHDVTAERLAGEIEPLLADAGRRAERAARMAAQGTPRAADELATLVLEVAELERRHRAGAG